MADAMALTQVALDTPIVVGGDEKVAGVRDGKGVARREHSSSGVGAEAAEGNVGGRYHARIYARDFSCRTGMEVGASTHLAVNAAPPASLSGRSLRALQRPLSESRRCVEARRRG